MNVIARLEYELAYYDSAVHRFNHYTTRTPQHLLRWLCRVLLQTSPSLSEWGRSNPRLRFLSFSVLGWLPQCVRPRWGRKLKYDQPGLPEHYSLSLLSFWCPYTPAVAGRIWWRWCFWLTFALVAMMGGIYPMSQNFCDKKWRGMPEVLINFSNCSLLRPGSLLRKTEMTNDNVRGSNTWANSGIGRMFVDWKYCAYFLSLCRFGLAFLGRVDW